MTSQRTRNEEIIERLTKIETLMHNHLAHHDKKEDWTKWIIPTTFGLINLLITIGLLIASKGGP